MLSDEKMFAATMVPRSNVARFMDEGLKIQDVQLVVPASKVFTTDFLRRKLLHLIQDTADHDLVARRKEITIRTSKTQTRIAAWRKTQKELMPRVADRVAIQALAAPFVQNEKLFLPSDFLSAAEREALDLTSLAEEEARWREGQAYDSLRIVQNIVKALSALRNRKKKNERHQKQNSRAGDAIEDTENRRDQHMESYEAARNALNALGVGSTFPPLKAEDLYMKSVQQKRRVGDSLHTDGALWRFQAPIPDDNDEDEPMGELTEVKAVNTGIQSHVLLLGGY